MQLRKKKKPESLNWLKVPDSEKAKLIQAIKASLEQRVIETKLRQSDSPTESLPTPNRKLNRDPSDPRSFAFADLSKSV